MRITSAVLNVHYLSFTRYGSNADYAGLLGAIVVSFCPRVSRSHGPTRRGRGTDDAQSEISGSARMLDNRRDFQVYPDP